MSTPVFPASGLAFLRSLARNNDREWFRARKERYEREVHGPMVALVEQLDRDFRSFAPELVAVPKRSIFRIYRDTRFSEDKSPLKTSIAAAFPHHALPRHAGAGLYLEVGPKSLLLAGGMYAPTSAELRAIRAHIAGNLTRLRSIVESPAFKRETGGLRGASLSRMPLGFPADHRAAAFLKMKQFLIWRELPPATTTSPRFYSTVLKVFRASAPLVRFLNEPLLGNDTSRAPRG